MKPVCNFYTRYVVVRSKLPESTAVMVTIYDDTFSLSKLCKIWKVPSGVMENKLS